MNNPTVKPDKYKQALLLETIRIMEINLSVINWLDKWDITEIPEAIFSQQVNRIPDSPSQWIQDTIDLIQISLSDKDYPFSYPDTFDEYDTAEMTGINVRELQESLSPIIEKYLGYKKNVRRQPIIE